MNFEKYKNDGWGLNRQQLVQILEIIRSSNNDEFMVVEFGSGKSTEFLVDVVVKNIKKLKIVSFDDNPRYAYKNNENHEFLDLHIRDLQECTDESYNKMFENRKLDKSLMYPKKTPLSAMQRNNFYNIKEGDINGICDFMILDGPNGNGRNISYLYMVGHLDVGSVVLIDDYTHYDFIEKFSLFFDFDILHEANNDNAAMTADQWWNTGGTYKILKITKKK